MKKLNLKTVKNSLKRDELRNVKGGSGGYDCVLNSNRCGLAIYLNTNLRGQCCFGGY